MIRKLGRCERSRPRSGARAGAIVLLAALGTLAPASAESAQAHDPAAALALGVGTKTFPQQQSALLAPMGLDFFVYFAEPVRPESVVAPTDREIEITQEHLEYLELLSEEGRLIMAGPSLDPPYTTVVVFLAADAEQARRTMESDPAVVGGRFRARLSRFNVFLMPVVEPVPQR